MSAAEQIALEDFQAKQAEERFLSSVQAGQPAKYATGAAKAAAEKDKRKRLREQIQTELRTPLKGCKQLTEREREKIRDRVKGPQLNWRGISA